MKRGSTVHGITAIYDRTRRGVRFFEYSSFETYDARFAINCKLSDMREVWSCVDPTVCAYGYYD